MRWPCLVAKHGEAHHEGSSRNEQIAQRAVDHREQLVATIALIPDCVKRELSRLPPEIASRPIAIKYVRAALSQRPCVSFAAMLSPRIAD